MPGLVVKAETGVLFLNSYYRGYSWSDTIYREFVATLEEKVPGINIFNEYMDTRNMSYQRGRGDFGLLFDTKYTSDSYKIIVACDIGALNFVIDNYQTKFSGKPVVFCEMSNFEPEPVLTDLQISQWFTGISGETDFTSLYELASSLYPRAKNVYCLVDATEDGAEYRRSIVKQLVRNLSVPVDFIDGSEHTSDEAISVLASVPHNSIVISTGWSGDRSNANVDEMQFIAKACQASPVPVFSISSVRDIPGPVGGYVIDSKVLGRKLGDMVSRILSGTSVSDIPIERKVYCRYVFDLKVLDKWNISLTQLPSGSDFVGEKLYSEIELVGDYVDLENWELSWLRDNNKLTVGIYDYPPFMMVGDMQLGYCIDYLELIAEKLAVKLNYLQLDIDHENSMYDSSPKPEIMLFAEKGQQDDGWLYSYPWMKIEYSLFARDNGPFVVYNGLDSLAGQVIAVEKRAAIYEILQQQHKDIKLMPVDSIDDCLNAVSSGNAYGCICSYSPAIYVARLRGFNDIKMVSEIEEFASMEYYLAVRKDIELLDNIIKKVSSSISVTQLSTLREKYDIEELKADHVSYLKFILWSVAFLLIVLTAVLILIFRLKALRFKAQQEQGKLQIIFQSLHDAIIMVDSSGSIIKMNSAAQVLTQWPADMAVGKALSDVFNFKATETQTGITELVKSALIKGNNDSIRCNGLFKSRNGGECQISLNIARIVGESAVRKNVVIVARDVTESYQVRQQLKKTELERELILSNIPVGLCFLDKDFRIVRINKEMEKIFSKSGSEVGGQKCFKVWFGRKMPCENCPACQALKTKTICRGKSPYPATGHDCDMVVVPIMDGDVLTGLLVMLLDVTEFARIRKDIETAYASLKEHSDRLVVLVERRSIELQKRNREVSDTLHELKAAQSKLILSEKMAALGQLIAGIAHEINTPLGAIGSSGENIMVSIMAFMDSINKLADWLRGDQAEAIMRLLDTFVTDAGANVLTTREARELKKKTEKELDAMGVSDAGELASYIADTDLGDNWREHVELFISDDPMVKLEIVSRVHDIINSCNTIETATSRASRIVRALKSYIHAGYDDDAEKQVKVWVDIREGLETVLTLFHNKIKNNIELEVEYEQVPAVFGYSDELNQVWTNLIQNSLYAMNGHGKLLVRVYNSGSGVAVMIKDNGCGMSPEVKARMFEPLYTTKPIGEGTGLGMDIVRRIVVENHKGKIEVDSTPDIGTAITVWLAVDGLVEISKDSDQKVDCDNR